MNAVRAFSLEEFAGVVASYIEQLATAKCYGFVPVDVVLLNLQRLALARGCPEGDTQRLRHAVANLTEVRLYGVVMPGRVREALIVNANVKAKEEA